MFKMGYYYYYYYYYYYQTMVNYTPALYIYF
jgi:hypothetical protein